LIWYTSDTHFDHKFVAKLRGFTKVELIKDEETLIGDTEAHDNAVIANWNTLVKPGDIVWHLGDVGMGHLDRFRSQVEQLNGHIHLITGNHDDVFPGHRDSHKFQRDWLQHFDSVQAYARRRVAGTRLLLSHFPYRGDHGPERYTQYRLRDEGLWLLHGHTHSTVQLTPRQLHVGLDAWGLHPVAESVVIKILEEVNKNAVEGVSLLPEGAEAHEDREVHQAPHVEREEDDQVSGYLEAGHRLTNLPTRSSVRSW
jgi:calcineurin-like phosphoesterase family protein